MAIIMLNMIVFMAFSHRQSQTTTKIFFKLNQIFLFIFVIEAILKILAHGVNYFFDAWNVFDFLIICISLGTILL